MLAITARLLCSANPRAESEQDYGITTAAESLMRTGMAPVSLLAMLDLLTRAMIKAFAMFHTPIAAAPVENLPPFTGEHVLGTVEFSGKATGWISVTPKLQDRPLFVFQKFISYHFQPSPNKKMEKMLKPVNALPRLPMS